MKRASCREAIRWIVDNDDTVFLIQCRRSGITSWVAGLRAVERFGKENCNGVFAETGVEDFDNYRFLRTELVRVFRETIRDNWIGNNAIPGAGGFGGIEPRSTSAPIPPRRIGDRGFSEKS